MIKIFNFYRIILVFLVFLVFCQIATYFMPWLFTYFDGADEALFWLGENSLIESTRLTVAIAKTLTFLYFISCVGLFFYNSTCRTFYTLLVVISGFSSPAFGISVRSGYEAGFIYFWNLADGLMIGILFFTEIKTRFAPKSNKDL